MSKKPVIGVILDLEPGKDANNCGYSANPWYAIRRNHLAVLQQVGANPLCIPYEADIDSTINLIDGLVVIGGDFDIPPNRYGHQPHKLTKTKPIRSNYEWEFLDKYINLNKPFLGICGGMQLLNVLQGGDIIQHIPDVGGLFNHSQQPPYNEGFHEVTVETGSLLHIITGADDFMVNSSHHQAIGKLGEAVLCNAKADDGVVEAISLDGHKFALGVQWHPEYKVTDNDVRIHQGLVENC